MRFLEPRTLLQPCSGLFVEQELAVGVKLQNGGRHVGSNGSLQHFFHDVSLV